METCNCILAICFSGCLCGVCLSGDFDQSLARSLAMGIMASHNRLVGVGCVGVVVFVSKLPTLEQIPMGSLDGNWIYFLFSVCRLRIILSILSYR